MPGRSLRDRPQARGRHSRAAAPRRTPKLLEPAWIAAEASALADSGAWSPQLLHWVTWELPVQQLYHIRLARATAAGHWCIPIQPPAAERAATLQASIAAQDAQFQY